MYPNILKYVTALIYEFLIIILEHFYACSTPVALKPKLPIYTYILISCFRLVGLSNVGINKGKSFG